VDHNSDVIVVVEGPALRLKIASSKFPFRARINRSGARKRPSNPWCRHGSVRALWSMRWRLRSDGRWVDAREKLRIAHEMTA